MIRTHQFARFVFVSCIAAVVCVFFARNILVKAAAEDFISGLTNENLKITSMKIGIRHAVIEAFDITLKNPPEFKQEELAFMPHLYIEYELLPLFARKAVFKKVLLEVQRLRIIVNPDGRVNLFEASKDLGRQKTAENKNSGRRRFAIKALNVEFNVGTVVVEDRSRGDYPQISEYDFAFNKNVLKDVDRPQGVFSAVYAVVMEKIRKQQQGIE